MSEWPYNDASELEKDIEVLQAERDRYKKALEVIRDRPIVDLTKEPTDAEIAAEALKVSDDE